MENSPSTYHPTLNSPTMVAMIRNPRSFFISTDGTVETTHEGWLAAKDAAPSSKGGKGGK